MLDDNSAEKEIKLIGFVYEIEDRGIVKGVAISTGDEDYIVEMDEWGNKLRQEIENDVEVTGIVTKNPDGKNHIFITGYQVLPEEFEPGNYNHTNGEEMY